MSYNYAVITEVPTELTDDYTSNRELASCDVVVLAFDSNSLDSFHFVLDIEGRLPDSTPRLYAGTRAESAAASIASSAFSKAMAHCQELGAPEPIVITNDMENVDVLQKKILSVATRPYVPLIYCVLVC